MSKTIIIGDIHGKSVWKLICDQNRDAKEIVFIGDYFDSRDGFTAAEQMFNFQEILRYKEDHPEQKVTLLIGNHDYGYFSGINGSNTSGYQHGAAPAINHVLETNKAHLQMAHTVTGIDEDSAFLFTHAGVGLQWLLDNGFTKGDLVEFINEQWKNKPLSFEFNGMGSPYGDDLCQTPIWIRPRSLMKGNHESLRNILIQVVGHTSVKEIDIKGKATGGRYYFIDALDAKQYLIITDGVPSLGKF